MSNLKSLVSQRNISTLVHFTREENLPSILENGLHSRESAEKNNIKIAITDDQRLDGHLEAISTSISFPNYRMFYPKRLNLSGRWAVLCISPTILWEKQCAFYKHNAASNDMQFPKIPSDVISFESMFEQNSKKVSGGINYRSNLNLSANQTTDPEAEVLVTNVIETKYITDICFLTRSEQIEFKKHIQTLSLNIDTHIYDHFYGPRHDWQYWR